MRRTRLQVCSLHSLSWVTYCLHCINCIIQSIYSQSQHHYNKTLGIYELLRQRRSGPKSITLLLFLLSPVPLVLFNASSNLDFFLNSLGSKSSEKPFSLVDEELEKLVKDMRVKARKRKIEDSFLIGKKLGEGSYSKGKQISCSTVNNVHLCGCVFLLYICVRCMSVKYVLVHSVSIK